MDQSETSQSDKTKEDCAQTINTTTKHEVLAEYFFNASLKEAEQRYEFFWKEEDVFSQWHKSSFKVDTLEFCCAEQYMMYTKAVLLYNDKLADKILKCSDPKHIKSLGRKTEQFSEELWVHNCLHVVKTGNMAKFSQNQKLREVLFSTYPRVLVEASPYDKVWGIGLSKYEPSAWNEATWDGKNLLGFILTEVRDELMCGNRIIKESDKKVYFDKLSDDLKKNTFRRNKHETSRKRYHLDGNLHPYNGRTDSENIQVENITDASGHSTTTSSQLTKSSADENSCMLHRNDANRSMETESYGNEKNIFEDMPIEPKT